jgi:hypothetical protein
MFKKSAVPAGPPLVRSLADANPVYAAAAETLARLKTKLVTLDAEENVLLNRIHAQPIKQEFNARVAELLGDEPIPDDEAPDGARARLRAINAERADLRKAVDIATQRVQTARFAASKTICDQVTDEYRQRVQTLAAALIAAHNAHAGLLELVDHLNTQDVAWPGHLHPLQATGIFGHHSERLAIWLRDAKAAGYIDSIPAGIGA